MIRIWTAKILTTLRKDANVWPHLCCTQSLKVNCYNSITHFKYTAAYRRLPFAKQCEKWRTRLYSLSVLPFTKAFVIFCGHISIAVWWDNEHTSFFWKRLTNLGQLMQSHRLKTHYWRKSSTRSISLLLKAMQLIISCQNMRWITLMLSLQTT